MLSLLCCAILIVSPLKISKGCGPYDTGFSGYSFINPAIADRESEYAPYILDFEDFYQNVEEAGAKQITSNLEEWKGRFCDLVSIKDLNAVIYNSSLSNLRVLQTSIKKKGKKIDIRFAKNGFAKHMKNHSCTETIDYLVFAKQCEPHVTASSSGWETPARDTIAMKELIETGKKAFLKTKSQYIKLRYAYQLIRLRHYTKNYSATIQLHDYLMPKVDKLNSILTYWIMGHKAGALQKMGNYVESAYLYSVIYKNEPGKRLTAKQSFRIKSDEDWKQCLLLCKDDSERAMLFVLRAQNEDSQLVEEMKKIYALNPLNENLELLLVREMKKLEKDHLGISFNNKRKQNKRFHKIPRKYAAENLIALQKFVRQIVKDQKVSRPIIWEIADAYLEVLAGDNYAARKLFENIDMEKCDETLTEQVEVFRLALEINGFQEMGKEEEERVYDIIKYEDYYKDYKDLPNFINDRLAALYQEQENPGLSFRMHYPISDMAPNPQLPLIDDLMAFCNEEDINKFTKILTTDETGKSILSTLLDMKGTYFMQKGKMEAAQEILKLIPREDRNIHQVNPFFRDEINDCVSCGMPDSTIRYNKVELIEKIFELEYQAKASFSEGAKIYYKLGQAYYNMSYYGNSWQTIDFFRSGSNWDYSKNDLYPSYHPFGNKENHDLSQALAYFDKAIEISKDPELSARAAFMAAKCQLNAYYNSKDCEYRSWGNKIPDPPAAYRKYYRLLNSDYISTQFYQEAIAECKFFKAYSAR